MSPQKMQSQFFLNCPSAHYRATPVSQTDLIEEIFHSFINFPSNLVWRFQYSSLRDIHLTNPSENKQKLSLVSSYSQHKPCVTNRISYPPCYLCPDPHPHNLIPLFIFPRKLPLEYITHVNLSNRSHLPFQPHPWFTKTKTLLELLPHLWHVYFKVCQDLNNIAAVRCVTFT